MTSTSDPFAATVRGIDEPDPVRAALRAAGPLVRAEAPAGGPVWIVTDDALARAVLTDPRLVKDTAWAPEAWDPRVAGLEPPAAVVPSLTTCEGRVHARLRQAHAPLFSARRLREHYGRMTGHARDLLTAAAGRSTEKPPPDGVGFSDMLGGTVDLTADFTPRYPLVVLLELLGAPLDRVDQAIGACRDMFGGSPGRAMGAFDEIAAAALADGRDLAEDTRRPGLAVELRDRLPDGLTAEQVRYLLFGLIFPGQLTTDPALGFVLADLLTGDGPDDPDALVRETLRRHPPAPFTLWRFTAGEVELAGVTLPARSPVLIDVLGVNTSGDGSGSDLSFGAGPHYCVGAQLAALELRAVVEVMRADFPDARLAVPRSALRVVCPGGIGGSRLAALPVDLRGGKSDVDGTAAGRGPSVAV